MEREELLLKQRSDLKDLWTHHNGTQLQWPSVVIGAALLVISNILSGSTSKLLDPSLWGHDPEVILKYGVPLIIAGLGINVMLYTMARARKIMNVIEGEIMLIENSLGISRGNFHVINHPGGLSGTRILRVYIALFLGFPTVIFGTAFVMGLQWSLIFWTTSLMVLLMILVVSRRSNKILPSYQPKHNTNRKTILPEQSKPLPRTTDEEILTHLLNL